MKKFFASIGLVALTSWALPAMADVSSSTNASASVTTPTCMEVAVTARNDSVVAARASFWAKVNAAVKARIDALAKAALISNSDERSAAITAAWDAYVKAVADARAQYRIDVQAASDTFVAARVKCHPAVNDHEKKEMKHGDRGLHLGIFKRFSAFLGLGTAAKVHDEESGDLHVGAKDRDEDKNEADESHEVHANQGLHLGAEFHGDHDGGLHLGLSGQGNAGLHLGN